MPYDLLFTGVAEDDIRRCPEALLGFLNDCLDRLAAGPSSCSRPTVSPPFAPGGMMAEFQRREGDTNHVFTIFFRYGADEVHLVVTGVSRRALDVSGG